MARQGDLLLGVVEEGRQGRQGLQSLRLQSPLKWKDELVKLQSSGHRFYVLAICWDSLPEGLDGLVSAIECLRRHGLDPVAALEAPSGPSVSPDTLQLLSSHICRWVTRMSPCSPCLHGDHLSTGPSVATAGASAAARRRRWGMRSADTSEGISESPAAAFFGNVHATLRSHAAAQEVLQDAELGIMLHADWVEGAETASQDAQRLNRDAAERILQCQIGCILSPLFHGEYPSELGLPFTFSDAEQSLLARTSFVMLLHNHAGQVQVEVDSVLQKTRVHHVAASPSTLSKVLKWLSWHGYCPAYCPPVADHLGGLSGLHVVHVVRPLGSGRQAATLRAALLRAIELGVPLRGVWASEEEACDEAVQQIVFSPSRFDDASAPSVSTALFTHPSMELGQLGSLSWIDPASVLITLDFLELCICLGSRPDPQKLIPQITLARCRQPCRQPDLPQTPQTDVKQARTTSCRARDARWSALLDQVVAKSCWRHVRARTKEGNSTTTGSTSPPTSCSTSLSESAVTLFLQFRRLQRAEKPHEPKAEPEAEPEASTKCTKGMTSLSPWTPLASVSTAPRTETPSHCPTTTTTLEAVVQLSKAKPFRVTVGSEPSELERLMRRRIPADNVGAEVARLRALGEALQHRPKPPSLQAFTEESSPVAQPGPLDSAGVDWGHLGP
ncbi:Kl [Symbiodinium natans]|uniref:Kl protein n=1 Tax=Symbiodinium natans TaxID=878477 RepID=A0A812RJA9_9DINO|nr:Kl [Symbiodinium natans]